MKLNSPAFHDQGAMPGRHTCEGEDVSPALTIDGVPPGSKSLALIVDDPDAPDPAAPKMTWVHWVLYNLPPATTALPEGAGAAALHALEGLNDWKQTGYRGPCPPIGRHRYFFKLFALDRLMDDLHQPTSAQLHQRIRGHVIEQATLVGTYEKSGR